MFEDILKWSLGILVLFPGLISILLAQYMADISDSSQTMLLIRAFALNLVDLAFAVPIFLGIARFIQRWGKLARAVLFAIVVLAVAFVVGVVGGVLYENDALLKLLRASPTTYLLTKRSFQRPLTFLLAQNRKQQLEEGRPPAMKVKRAWIQVHLTDGNVVEGWPEFFTIGSGATEIFLSPACQRVRQEKAVKTVSVPGPGILIFEKDIRRCPRPS